MKTDILKETDDLNYENEKSFVTNDNYMDEVFTKM